VAAFRIGVGDLHAEGRASQTVHRRSHVAALVVEESFPVAYQVLQIADLRRVDGGVITFGDNPIGDRVPYSTGSRVGRPHRLLCASRPARWNARCAGGWILNGHNGVMLWAVERNKPKPESVSRLDVPRPSFQIRYGQESRVYRAIQ